MSAEDKNVSVTVDDQFERYKDKNYYNYTDYELSVRKKAIRDAAKDYPHVPEAWIEMLYDVVEKGCSKEEVEDIIKNNKWGGKPKERVMGGQIVGAVEILDDETKKTPLKELV